MSKNNKDKKNRVAVVDLIDTSARIYPVGRLDYDTTGALILTNDGELANLLMSPSSLVDKTYVAKVKGIVQIPDMQKLRSGVIIDGVKTKKAQARRYRPTPPSTPPLPEVPSSSG